MVALISFLSTPQVPYFFQHGLLLLLLKRIVFQHWIVFYPRATEMHQPDSANAYKFPSIIVFTFRVVSDVGGWITSSSQTKTNNLRQQINLVIYCERTSNYPGLLCPRPKFSPLKPLCCLASMHR